MTITEQIKAYKDDGTESNFQIFLLDLEPKDLLALVDSHERLLKVCKMMAGPAPEYENAEQAVADRLRDEQELRQAIEEAEKL